MWRRHGATTVILQPLPLGYLLIVGLGWAGKAKQCRVGVNGRQSSRRDLLDVMPCSFYAEVTLSLSLKTSIDKLIYETVITTYGSSRCR